MGFCFDIPFIGLAEDHVEKILKNDSLALRLWDSNKKLNAEQCRAIELAIKRKFQLIQGPPGI